MKWFWMFNTPLGFLFSLMVAVFLLLVVLISIMNAVTENASPTGRLISLASALLSGLVIFTLIYNGLFTITKTTDKENMVISKAEEILDATTGYIKKGQGPLHYSVIIDNVEYIFHLSQIGTNVDSIYRNDDLTYELVYQGTKENIDEWLDTIEKLATAKVREITKNQSALIQDIKGSGKYLVESEDKLYTVKVNSKEHEVEYVLHNVYLQKII